MTQRLRGNANNAATYGVANNAVAYGFDSNGTANHTVAYAVPDGVTNNAVAYEIGNIAIAYSIANDAVAYGVANYAFACDVTSELVKEVVREVASCAPYEGVAYERRMIELLRIRTAMPVKRGPTLAKKKRLGSFWCDTPKGIL